MPLIDRDGYALGTLCLIDRVPKRLSWRQKQTLSVLGRQVVAQLELRQRNRQLAQCIANGKQADAMRAKFVFALEQTSNAIAFLDQAGYYTYVNRAHATMYGYEPAELIGKSWKIFHTAACISTMDTKVFPLLLKEGGWTGDIIGRQQNGNALTATVSLALFPAQAQSNGGLLWICHDLGRRVRPLVCRLPHRPLSRLQTRSSLLRLPPYGSCSWKIWKTIASWFPSY